MLLYLRRARSLRLILVLTAVPFSSHAVTILTGPTFTKATNAPLAGVLQLSTDVATRVSVSVNDGTNLWERRFYDYATTHSIPLFGFKPARTNQLTVTVYDQQRRQFTASQPLPFVTSSLPSNFPILTLLHSEPERMEPGYTLFRTAMKGETFWYVTIVDSAGQVVWYGTPPTTADVRWLANGHLFMPSTNDFYEIDLLGQTVQSWDMAPHLLINLHDGVPTDHGTILYLSNTNQNVSNYPTSMTDSNAPLATQLVNYEKVVEISMTNSSQVQTWTPFDELDPRRISYLISKFGPGWDSEHCNAVIEDPSDDSLIVSMRHQNALVKISRATGELIWILGPHENWNAPWQPYLLTPVGTPFFWQYGQHSPILTPQGTLLVHDNGNFKAMPFAASVAASNNYTRAVEYSINEQTMEISQVWEYGRTNMAQRIYSDHEGSVEPEPKTGNVLIDFAAISYVDGAPPSTNGPAAYMTRITEVTHDSVPQVVFDLALSLYSNTNTTYKDVSTYRAHRIPDLYTHPALPVADLSVRWQGGMPHLDFSADDALTYNVQSSSNLLNWQTIGVAVEDDPPAGNFSFADPASDPSARYYRVVTQ